MNRQKARQRLSSHRMIPPNLCVPSVEESLQSWLLRDKTISTLCLPDSCRCCQRPHCENLEATVFTIRRLEEEARLAAEIGQILLYKHEQYVMESNEMTSHLEEQLLQAQEKAHNLEQLLIQSDTVIDDLEHERNKLAWEHQKTQKVLDKTLKEVENCYQRSNQLVNELDVASKEVEKLRVRQSMADEADLREENLRSEMEEVKQELAASKKAEHAMESKYKKLMSKYESICEEDQSIDSAKVFKPKSFIGERTPENNKHLIQLIKELVSANNKLKIDLLEQSTEHEQELDGSTVCDTTEPVIHHHYHYRQEETTSPAYQLYHNICLVMERLQQTDTRALNRKLRRAFDIFDLSSMSNSLIENILASEVESLPKNMLSSNEDFSLLAQVVQDMLKEIAILRITINDIQVEYVKKVEESDLRLEKEIQREPTVLDWLSNVFHNGPHQKIIQRRSSLPSTITSSRMSKDHSSRIVRYSGPSSSYPTRTSCYKRRLAVTHPLRASQTPTVQKYSCIRKRRSLLVINSSETTGWLGNKINK